MIKGYRVDLCISFNDGTKAVENKRKMFKDKIDACKYVEKIAESLMKDAKISYRKISPVVKCGCGMEVLCVGFTNTCIGCDTDYNFNGDMLAPREQWGEETGESWWECY